MSKTITKLVLATALTATPVVVTSAHPVAAAKTFNIKKYGAKGHGADDTRAIQAAVDAASRGGTVVVPKGTWRSQIILLQGNTTLKLKKGAVMKRLPFKKAKASAFVVFHGKKKKYGGFHKVVIEGGTWDGGVHKNNKTSQYKGFELDHGANLTIRNTTIKNMSGLHMIETNACKNVTIDHVHLKNQYFYNGKNHSSVANFTPNTCEAIQFDSATKGAASASPLDHTVCQNYKITNCTFDHVQSAVGTHHNEKKYWKYMHKNIKISNNTIKNIKGDAIHLNNVNGGTISGNKCTTGGHKFITLYHSKNINLSKNTARKFKSFLELGQGTNANLSKENYTDPVSPHDPGNTVLLDQGTSANIANSKFETKAQTAILLQRENTLHLTNSEIVAKKNSSPYSILAHSAKKVTIDSTTFTGNGKNCEYGLFVDHSSDLTLKNNHFSGYDRDVFLKGCQNRNIQNNTINDKTIFIE